jgi:hypothetical protein
MSRGSVGWQLLGTRACRLGVRSPFEDLDSEAIELCEHGSKRSSARLELLVRGAFLGFQLAQLVVASQDACRHDSAGILGFFAADLPTRLFEFRQILSRCFEFSLEILLHFRCGEPLIEYGAVELGAGGQLCRRPDNLHAPTPAIGNGSLLRYAFAPTDCV